MLASNLITQGATSNEQWIQRIQGIYKLLKYKLGSVEGSCLLPVTEFNEFSETFRKNSNRSSSIKASSVFQYKHY